MTILHRILHVEDDESIRTVAKAALERVGGFEVLSCEGGNQALAQIVDFDPQLILLDVMMPEMDGPTTLKLLQEQNDLSEIPVLFMTAKVQHKEMEYYRSIGAFEVIVKPFDPMSLPDEVREHWRQFHAMRN